MHYDTRHPSAVYPDILCSHSPILISNILLQFLPEREDEITRLRQKHADTYPNHVTSSYNGHLSPAQKRRLSALFDAAPLALFPHRVPSGSGGLQLCLPHLATNPPIPTSRYDSLQPFDSAHVLLTIDTAPEFAAPRFDLCPRLLDRPINFPAGKCGQRTARLLFDACCTAYQIHNHTFANTAHARELENLCENALHASARTWRDIIALIPAITTRALRKLRLSDIATLEVLLSPCQETTIRRAQYALAHPTAVRHVLRHADDIDRRLARIDRNAKPQELLEDLPDTHFLVSTTSPVRTAPRLTRAQHAIQDLCDPKRIHKSAAVRGRYSPRNPHYRTSWTEPDFCRASSAIIRDWNAVPRLREEHANRPDHTLERLVRALVLAARFCAPTHPLAGAGNANGVPLFPVHTVSAIAAAGAQDELPEDTSLLADAISGYITHCVQPLVTADHLHALQSFKPSHKQDLPRQPSCSLEPLAQALAPAAVACWFLAPHVPAPLRPADESLHAPPNPSISPRDLDAFQRAWHRAIYQPSAAELHATTPNLFPGLPENLRLPENVSHIRSPIALKALGQRQAHCIPAYQRQIADGTLLCFSIHGQTAQCPESTFTVRLPTLREPGRPPALHAHYARFNAKPSDGHQRIAGDTLQQILKHHRDVRPILLQRRQPGKSLEPPPPDPTRIARAWELLYRPSLPPAFLPLDSSAELLPALLESLTPKWAKALRLIRTAHRHGIRFSDLDRNAGR